MNVTKHDVIAVVSDVLSLPTESFSAASSSEDFPEWDSLGHLRICMAIEEAYGVKIELEQMGELTSVERLVGFLQCV